MLCYAKFEQKQLAKNGAKYRKSF